ncbi:forkhead box protein J3-like [Liolophura sinensis]|uniref:forkhead box protein J3-like n=1 Tax=Liolophura sinensis TaxID=3198878 RepID=UPI003159030A
MCSNTTANMMPFGLRVPNPAPLLPILGGVGQSTLDFHRAQVYDYSSRLNLQFALRGYPTLPPYHTMGNTADPFRHLYLYAKHDPRANFIHEEPKPSQSYIGLIAMAILSIPDKKMVLSDIYQYILDHYPYFRTRGPGWRNSIRHNLSLNDCFIKAGRSANGKGHYWAIHPANLEDFKKGDFRRRRAQRRVRKYLGLSVPDDEDSPSPSPTNTNRESWIEDKPSSESAIEEPKIADGGLSENTAALVSTTVLPVASVTGPLETRGPEAMQQNDGVQGIVKKSTGIKRRLFDMESLLAPDTESPRAFKTFVAADLTVRRGTRENAEDSDTEIVVTDEIGSSHSDKLSSQFSPDSGHETLDHSSLSKGDEDFEGNSVDGDQSALDLHLSRARQVPHTGADGDGTPTVIKIHTAPPTLLTNGLGMPFAPNHLISSSAGQGGLAWPDRPSAFQRMVGAPVAGSLTPTSYSSLLGQTRPSFPICLTTADTVTSAQKWQETLSRIMARSYDKTMKTDS